AGDLLLLGGADPEDHFGLDGSDPPFGFDQSNRPQQLAGAVVARDATTGDEGWRIESDLPFLLVSAEGGVAYVHATQLGLPGSEVIAVDAATGAELWRTAVGSGSSPPFVASDAIY